MGSHDASKISSGARVHDTKAGGESFNRKNPLPMLEEKDGVGKGEGTRLMERGKGRSF